MLHLLPCLTVSKDIVHKWLVLKLIMSHLLTWIKNHSANNQLHTCCSFGSFKVGHKPDTFDVCAISVFLQFNHENAFRSLCPNIWVTDLWGSVIPWGVALLRRGSPPLRLIGARSLAVEGGTLESCGQRSLQRTPSEAQCLVLPCISEMNGWPCPAETPPAPSDGSDKRRSNVTWRTNRTTAA